MFQKRDAVKAVIFTIITCGIYGIFWVMKLNDEAKLAAKDESLPSGGMVILLTIVTCGIYGYYWSYKMGQILYKAQLDRNIPTAKDNSVLYLILNIIGLSIVNYVLMQNSLNEMAE